MDIPRAIPATDAARITAWVEEQFADDVRSEAVLEARITGSDADIVERRKPEGAPAASEDQWDLRPVARLRHLDSGWRLYCPAAGGFQVYEPLPEAAALEDLFAEVDEDPYNLFWG